MAHQTVLAAIALVTAASVAQAACKDDIAQLDAQSSQKVASSIATSSGGQGEAAQKQASQAGHGPADQAMQAKVALGDAKMALSKGDETGCEAAIGRARSDVKN